MAMVQELSHLCNKSVLDSIQEAFTTVLKTAYNSSVTWISTNGTNLINHLSNTSNPHETTHDNLSGTLNGGGDYHLSQTDYTNKITNRRFASDANVATITPTGLAIGSQLVARLRRIASTGTAPAANPWVLACQLHIECDTLGSRAIATK